MMPNITRGDRVAGLMTYLVGVGRSNEHSNPHVVAGHDVMTQAAPTGGLSIDDALDLANLLDQPRKVFGTRVTLPVKEWNEEHGQLVKVGEKDAHVWHASLSLKAEDGSLTDHQWEQIANDFVSEMGFVDPDGAQSCRWVAVRHGVSTAGNDHIHIAVNLVREDGSRAPVHNDFKRAQKACNMIEHKYALTVVESREQDRETLRGNKPAELERARRGDANSTQRDELRRRLRAVATASTNEHDFVERTRESRVLIRPRFAKGDTSKVVGYSAALVPEIVDGERQRPVWFAGSKLDSNLGLGQLRSRWCSTSESERAAVETWNSRARAVSAGEHDVSERIRPERLPVETVRRLNAVADQIVIPDSTVGFDRFAAVQLSGAFAQASVYFEKSAHGPLADASEAFARYSQKDKYSREQPDRVRLQSSQSASNAAYVARLSARATGKDPVTGWTAVFRQLGRLSKAVEGAQRARGELRAAETTGRLVRSAMATIESATRQVTSPPERTHGSRDLRRDGNRDRGHGRD